MANRLQHETSPYLLQHAENPVDWFPWGEEAFRKAKTEDKPVFLSIGYSTCHWCHVMAHESFEDAEIAQILNRHFVAIKVDKEERQDVDSIYMAVCQAFTGSGGWPTSIFMTADQKPFFAGTYFPKRTRGRMVGFKELLEAIHKQWEIDRSALLQQADEVLAHLKQEQAPHVAPSDQLIESAVAIYKRIYDRKNGGFGHAPKFPTPHNLLFLMTCYERQGDQECLAMAEHTLLQMYRGGLFDHIGFGFCRYSTGEYYLAPHFEKMLYDNALLILAYCKAYALTKKPLYLEIAEKTAIYILREMTSPEGAFYSAQDADSFIRKNLQEGDTLYVSFRNGRRGVKGFLDEYAAYLFAQLVLYGETLDRTYLNRTLDMIGKINQSFRDEGGGYYFYGEDHEALILRPKETYDGAIPSGNGLMAWNLVQLTQLVEDEQLRRDSQNQLDFLSRETAHQPIGHAMFLLALLDWNIPPTRITVVPADDTDASLLPLQLPLDAAVTLLHQPSADYPLKNGKTTYYICRNLSCLPPTNDLRMYDLL